MSYVHTQFAPWIGATYDVAPFENATQELTAMVSLIPQNEEARLHPGRFFVNSKVTGQDTKSVSWETDFGFKIDLPSALNLFCDSIRPHDLATIPYVNKIITGGTSDPTARGHMFNSFRISETGATSNYEFDAFRFGVVTLDASHGSGNDGVGATVNKDAVALRADGYLGVGNLSGRVWAGNFVVNIPNGSEGFGSILELDMNNIGGAAPSNPIPNTPFMKHGIQIVVTNGAGSDALRIGGALGDGWWHGIWCQRDALVNDNDARFVTLRGALGIGDLFGINRNGAIMVGDATGGFNGEGTINVSGGYYINNVAVTSGGPYQPLDADLTTIAGLTATTDSFMQAKGSAWAARTIDQVKSDLSLEGANTGDQTIILTGDVTGSGTGSFDASLANNAVTNAKLNNMAANTIKLNNTGISANPIDATLLQFAVLTGSERCVSSGAALSVPADTTEDTLVNYSLPANSLGPNGYVEIFTLWSYTGSVNAKTMKVKFGGTSYFAFAQSTAINVSTGTKTVIHNNNATGTQIGTPSGSATPYSSSTGVPASSSVNTTAAVTILITGQKASAGETLTLVAYYINAVYMP